nr:hypothetical protein [Tanacetum cinerariifolium]
GVGEQGHMGCVGEVGKGGKAHGGVSEVGEWLCTAQVQGIAWDDEGIVFVVLAGKFLDSVISRGWV